VDLLIATNWDGAVMQYYEEFYASYEEEELPELTSVFPDDPEPAQAELNMAAQMAESDSHAGHGHEHPTAEHPAAEEPEPQMVEVDSATYLIDANEAQVETVTVEAPQLRNFGVMGTAAVSLGGLMLVVVVGTLAVSRKSK
jgi:hypothetical protein